MVLPSGATERAIYRSDKEKLTRKGQETVLLGAFKARSQTHRPKGRAHNTKERVKKTKYVLTTAKGE